MEALIAIVAGAAVFLFLAYAVRARALRPTAEGRLRVLSAPQSVRIERTKEGEALLKRTSSAFPTVTRFLNANGYADRWEKELERADLKLRPSEYFMTRLALAVVVVAIITVIGQSALAFFVGLPAGFVGFMLPSYWISMRVRHRKAKIDSQLVETIGLIANSLRAGFAFAQAADIAAKRVGGPMADEINRMLLDVNLGMNIEDALNAMNVRINSDDIDMVVTAILIQRQSGGNLAEVLEQVTETMRDRERIQGEIKTMTSQQRFTGIILSGWPILLGLVFFAFSPGIVSLFWTTGPGLLLLGIWFTLWLVGVIAVQRILDIDV